MSIVIVSECEKAVAQVKQFLQEMEITKVWHYKTVEDAELQLTELQQAKVEVIIINADCTYENREQIYGDIAALRDWLDVPVILMTSYDTRETIGGAFFAGIFDFMLKPVDFSYFKARMHIAIKYNSESRRMKVQEYNIEQDLLIAKKVQKSALTAPLHLDWLQVDGFNRMSHTLGGDMYHWAQVSEHQVAVVLYDVMGHGVASALVSMSIRSILRELMNTSTDGEHIIQVLNQHVYELFEGQELDGFLVTAIYMLVDHEKRTVHYVNAAHPTGFLFHENAVQPLMSNTPILGLLPMIYAHQEMIVLQGRGRVVMYTDGLQPEEQLLTSTYFTAHVTEENDVALQQFVQKHHLETRAIQDDISVIFMTIV